MLGRSLARFALGCALASVAFASAGCPKKRGVIPTERLHVTKVAAAPALSDPDPNLGANRAVRWGEAYFVRGERPDFQWTGVFEGRTAQRKGLLEVSRGLTDAPRFAFGEDFLEADVPQSAWLCSRMALRSISASACADGLLRTVASQSTLLAHIPCWRSDCPIAELKDGVVTSGTIPALSDLRVVAIDKRPVALAWSHFIQSPEWIHTDLVVMQLDPPLQRAGEIRLAETDARDPGKVVYWLGELTILDDGLRVRGRRSLRNRASNEEISGANVDERWTLGADGKLIKR